MLIAFKGFLVCRKRKNRQHKNQSKVFENTFGTNPALKAVNTSRQQEHGKMGK